MNVRFATDLTGIQFDESKRLGWVNAFKFGTYKHPIYGTINVDRHKAERYVANVNNRVRGIDIDIDYDHKAKTDEAAGWVKRAELREDGAFLQVEFTPKAFEKIKNKEYRYFSPEFTESWTDNQGITHDYVLLGGGLTNRPFLKDLDELALTASEYIGEEQMDLAKLRTILKLDENATAEDVEAAVAKLQVQDGDPKDDKPEGDKPEGDKPEGDKPEGDQESAKLSEDVIKRLSEQEAEIVKLKETARIAEISLNVKQFSEKGKLALTPVAEEKLRASMKFAESGTPADKALAEFVQLVVDGKATVQLGEVGTAKLDESTGAEDEFRKGWKALAEKEGLAPDVALRKFAEANPELTRKRWER